MVLVFLRDSTERGAWKNVIYVGVGAELGGGNKEGLLHTPFCTGSAWRLSVCKEEEAAHLEHKLSKSTEPLGNVINNLRLSRIFKVRFQFWFFYLS